MSALEIVSLLCECSRPSFHLLARIERRLGIKEGSKVLTILTDNGLITSSYDPGGSGFHLFCPVEWLCPTEEESKFDLARKEERGELWPNMVWQPDFEGEYCQPVRLDAIKDGCKKFTIFAPSYIDLLAMCSRTSAFENKVSRFNKTSQRIHNGRKVVEECARGFLESGIGVNGLGYMVVEAGELGCLVASLAFGDRFTWLAALKEAPTDARERITEFVGAVSFAAFVQKHNIIRAAKLGMVAASFAGVGGVSDASTFRTRMDAYSEVLREEDRRFQVPRDLDNPSAYTSDEDDGYN
jgi:hypothetical protein